jgi:gamma-glutamylcyclotransferase (GGCT)/AIG2-like uncharacterized protein YtfP
VRADLFAYGSLRFPAVVRTLIDRAPDASPALAEGWRVAALRDEVYPALVPDSGSAPGTLLTGLTPAEWQVLDAFENPVYDLRQLTLDRTRTGWAYVCLNEAAVLPEAWNMAWFARDEIGAYVERCRKWREWYEGRRS